MAGIFGATQCFAAGLKANERMVKVFIRISEYDRDGPYLVPFDHLNKPSTRSLIPRIVHVDHLDNPSGHEMQLEIRNMDVYHSSTAGITMLHFIIHETLPDGFAQVDGNQHGQLALGYAWGLSHQYQMPEFQDAVMHQLLRVYNAPSIGHNYLLLISVGCQGRKLEFIFIEGLVQILTAAQPDFTRFDWYRHRPHFWDNFGTALQKRGRDRLEEGTEYWRE